MRIAVLDLAACQQAANLGQLVNHRGVCVAFLAVGLDHRVATRHVDRRAADVEAVGAAGALVVDDLVGLVFRFRPVVPADLGRCLCFGGRSPVRCGRASAKCGVFAGVE